MGFLRWLVKANDVDFAKVDAGRAKALLELGALPPGTRIASYSHWRGGYFLEVVIKAAACGCGACLLSTFLLPLFGLSLPRVAPAAVGALVTVWYARKEGSWSYLYKHWLYYDWCLKKLQEKSGGYSPGYSGGSAGRPSASDDFWRMQEQSRAQQEQWRENERRAQEEQRQREEQWRRDQEAQRAREQALEDYRRSLDTWYNNR